MRRSKHPTALAYRRLKLKLERAQAELRRRDERSELLLKRCEDLQAERESLQALYHEARFTLNGGPDPWQQRMAEVVASRNIENKR